ncbi:DUF2336 domain-containing protein [Plastoroseomonas arctica]|uniref:DUF2336 domain-containing protein n=1 Tax=Plastoroseomonas arctica TaxID=1509237 RepID=A0AAF1KJD6_9PROT|nr:DUF2336 domain-containing protein [Plastoroseomonas arctica]MBR0654900.1 DUF2336 domain-containing protein [Plastoroseomonas arctica]
MPAIIRDLPAPRFPSARDIRAPSGSAAAFPGAAHRPAGRIRAEPVERATLAARMALLATASLSDSQEAQIRGFLERLGDDAELLVRATIALAVQRSTTAPRQVIRRLARDAQASVSGPVLRTSPLLAEAELIELALAPPGGATRATIAARTDIGPGLAAAIIATQDRDAVAILLGNPGARIDADALQTVVEAARREPSWQAALVTRAGLPREAALAIGEYVTGERLAALAARLDLPPDTTAALLELMIRRLGTAPPQGEDDAAAFERAWVLHNARLLCDALVQQAALREEDRFVIAALKIRSGVDVRVIDRVIERRDAEAVAALAARAGFGFACTQAVVALLGPSEHRRADPERRTRHRYLATQAG